MTEHIEKSPTVDPAVSWGAVTAKGKVREENEDSYFVNEELSLFILSDGMGGHRGGRLASKIVVEELPVWIETKLHQLRSGSRRAVSHLLKSCLVQQNRHLFLEGKSESGYADMGATVAVVFVREKRVYVANVGDSRVFRWRGGRLWQVTKDHSVISELLEEKKIEPSEVEGHPAQGEVTQYMGMVEDARPHVRSFPLEKGDGILLCSDGLTDMLSEEQIGGILKDGQEPGSICRRLVDAANEAGGHDNITAIYLCD